ncbi:MAG: hypothetical protein K9L62_00245 [Vallitaleaceae bacterium]|nr:hypothetical protein [Vallitaleaceae bacterium]
MNRYLMTHSLLSSWMYVMKENPYEDMTTEKDSYAEFLTTLKREPTTTTDAMQKGIDFENLVTDITLGRGDKTHNWYEAASTVARIVNGGLLQYRAHREIEVKGVTLLLYGRLDALKAGTIYDIKFSGSYDAGKYIDSTQHPTYLELVPEARDFTYLVSNGSYVWPETYCRDEAPSIIPVIEDFFDWLDVQGLTNIYKEKWLAL